MARVLLIDDDEMLLSVLERSLTRAGYTVTAAADGEAALLALSDPELQVHVIVTDIIMPNMEGIETIRALHDRAAGVPIIAMSGGTSAWSPKYLVLATALGAVAALSKPFDHRELFAAIEQALNPAPA